MHDAQPSVNDDCLGTAVGVNFVHIGLAWAVAGVAAVYGGLWIALTVPAVGVLLWLVSGLIVRALRAHKTKLSSAPGFAPQHHHGVTHAA